MKVLFVEDSLRLQDAVGTGLRKAGFAVDIAEDGDTGLYLSENNEYDAIILDIMLPGIDGLTILQKLRAQGSDVHILILTARSTIENRVEGLQLGADDYLVKPFAFDELLARIQALVRRKYKTKSPVLRIENLQINTVTKTVLRNGKSITLSPREYMVLEFLALKKGKLVSRAEIEKHIYDEIINPMSNVIDSIVCKVRKKINTSKQPNMIHTRRGLGYIMQEGSE